MYEWQKGAGQLSRSGGARKKKEQSADHNLAFASKAGNRAIQRLLDSGSTSGARVHDSVQRKIAETRGGGESISSPARAKAERALRSDFSDVRIHHDEQADGLSRSLRANAFTTGNDIYFKSGAYDPISQDGQKLLAHELTHVFQQRAAGSVEDKVSDPGDASEVQAHQVADVIADGGQTELDEMEDLVPAGLSLDEDEDMEPLPEELEEESEG